MHDNYRTFKDFKIGAYLRKSDESDDKQMQSIEDQHTVTDELEKRYDFESTKRYTDEKSAKEAFKRIGFSQMIEDVERGKVDALACWKLNRLARNLIEAGIVLDYLSAGKIKAIITPFRVYYPTDNTVALVVEFGVATQTSKDISTDVKRGNRLKAGRGWNPSPILKMGYAHNSTHKTLGGSPVVPAENFPIVKQLWREALEHNYSFADLKRRGDELGNRQTSKKHKGQQYSYNAYRSAFTDPFYATGEFYRVNTEEGKVKYFGKHKKMLSEADFNRLQLQFGKKGRPTRINKNDWSLSGCLSCGTCDCAVVYERVFRATCTSCKKRYSLKTGTACPRCGVDVSEMDNPVIYDRAYGRCSKQRNKDGFKCTESYIEATEAERQVQEHLSEIEISRDFHDWALAAFQFMHKEEIKEQDNFNQQINKQETDLTKQLREFFLMRSRGEITPEQLQEFTADVESELSSVRAAKKNYHERMVDWVKIGDEYLTYAEKAPKIFTEATNERKREILRTFGSNLKLKDGKLYFTTPKVLVGIKSTYNHFLSNFTSLEPQTSDELQGFVGLKPHGFDELRARRDSNPQPPA